MVARNRIRCLVVAVPAAADRSSSRGALARDLLPWADPYVAGLIRKLQDEVRRERRRQSLFRPDRLTASRWRNVLPPHDRWAAELADEADPSWDDPQIEFEPAGDDGGPDYGDQSDDALFGR